MREVTATGIEALMMASQLLQRARRADPTAGLWEAADVQWSWRTPRPSDEVAKPFWADDIGPVAGVLLTALSSGAWQCDPVAVPGASHPQPSLLWSRGLEHANKHAPGGFYVPVGDDDLVFTNLARRSGLSAEHRDTTAWLDSAVRPESAHLAAGFRLLDRSERAAAPHPMRIRSGERVAQRLEQCPLYDPTLDLAIVDTDGHVAGYSLYWFDPMTKVGLVEPVRVEERYRRRGLARAMLSAGIDRLTRRGALRIKVSYETEAAGELYRSLGFQPASTTTWYRSPPDPPLLS